MNEINIRKYAQLMGELGLTGLEIRSDDHVVRLERSHSVPQQAIAPVAPAVVPTEATDSHSVIVRSPMVGVFYQAPAENAAPYVKAGDYVKRGMVLCLIEAMKMMNEISAECDGVIEEVCVSNGQVVDYGRELFRIKR